MWVWPGQVKRLYQLPVSCWASSLGWCPWLDPLVWTRTTGDDWGTKGVLPEYPIIPRFSDLSRGGRLLIYSCAYCRWLACSRSLCTQLILQGLGWRILPRTENIICRVKISTSFFWTGSKGFLNGRDRGTISQWPSNWVTALRMYASWSVRPVQSQRLVRPWVEKPQPRPNFPAFLARLRCCWIRYLSPPPLLRPSLVLLCLSSWWICPENAHTGSLSPDARTLQPFSSPPGGTKLVDIPWQLRTSKKDRTGNRRLRLTLEYSECYRLLREKLRLRTPREKGQMSVRLSGACATLSTPT